MNFHGVVIRLLCWYYWWYVICVGCGCWQEKPNGGTCGKSQPYCYCSKEL